MLSLESISESIMSPCVFLIMQLTWGLSVNLKQKLFLVYSGQLEEQEELQCSFFLVLLQ